MEHFIDRGETHEITIRQRMCLVILIVIIYLLGHLVWGMFLVPPCPSLSLSPTPILPQTVLASYPGSGNTWTRHLLQKTTGLVTGHRGFIHYFIALGFPGEGIYNSSVLTVKTHDNFNSTRHNMTAYPKAILLIRDPYEALLAEYRRSISKNHTGLPTIEKFAGWEKKFGINLQKYRSFYNSWLKHKDIFLLFYHDLKRDVRGTLLRILSYLEMSHMADNIHCALENIEGNFHRNEENRMNYMFFYSKAMINMTNAVIKELHRNIHKRFNKPYDDIKLWLK